MQEIQTDASKCCAPFPQGYKGARASVLTVVLLALRMFGAQPQNNRQSEERALTSKLVIGQRSFAESKTPESPHQPLSAAHLLMSLRKCAFHSLATCPPRLAFCVQRRNRGMEQYSLVLNLTLPMDRRFVSDDSIN
jgi:hypothetical protein